ncbi:MAG: Crp/Fnr family transcriptional regulator [Bacteroidota bacterium]
MQLGPESISKYKLSEEELKITMSGYTPLSVPANGFFLKEGEVCPYIGFVTKGLLRSYTYDDRANEITREFYPDNSLIISMDSFNNQVPSKENIRAIEDSELMVISFEKQKELYELVPVWNRICKELADQAGNALITRSYRFQTLSAAERYRLFCEEHPQLLQRATLGHIASYLGVDIATLSRIRKKW